MKQQPSLRDVMSKLDEFLAERDWEKFHDPKNLAMSIGIEAGELMEIFQWRTNSQAAEDAARPEIRARVREELADVMLYCLDLARIFDIDVAAAMLDKIAKNAEKYPTDRFRGSARKYDDPP